MYPRGVGKMEQFKYLGNVVTADVRCTTDIKMRIGIAKTAFRKMAQLLTNSRLGLPTRKRVIKTCVWSTVLYGCEAWI